MSESRKRSLDEDAASDDAMARIKTAPDAAAMKTLASMSPENRAILEQAARLLNMPIAALIRQKESSTAESPRPSESRSPRPEATLSSNPEHSSSKVVALSAGQPAAVPEARGTTTGNHLPSFNGVSYDYSAMVPWDTSDASPYRDSNYVAYRERLVHGYNDLRSQNPNHHPTASAEPAPEPVLALDEEPEIKSTDSITNYTIPSETSLTLVSTGSLFPGNFSPSEYLPSDPNDPNTSHAAEDILSTGTGEFTFDLIRGPKNADSSSWEENAAGQFKFVAEDPTAGKVIIRKPRGAFASDDLRKATSQTRKSGACVRCRMQKVRCVANDEDPGGVCMTCRNINATQTVHRLPCLRYRLTECIMFRVGKAPGMEYSARWPVMKLKDITKWASPEIRKITVRSDVSTVPFDLQVKRFVPIPQDSLHRSWMDGKTKKHYETTPYAICDMKAAMAAMRKYITNTTIDSMNLFLESADELVKTTFSYAQERLKRVESEDEATLLANYMKLWVAIRRTATLEHIISEDTLDMLPELTDKSQPLVGKVPLPPVMIQQLDIILTLGVLLPLQKLVLEDLHRLVISNNPRTWMTMYLITFMSLSSCASLTAENYRNARRQGFRRRYSYPSFIEERHHSANVFLSYYHYRTESCNPFEIDWKRRHATPFADMSTQDVIFLQKTKELLQDKDRAFAMKRAQDDELYENDLYFISQMYQKNWQPKGTRIDYDGGTVHGGPIKKYYKDDESDA